MADSTTNVVQLVAGQAQHEVTANGLFDAASHALTFGRRQEASISHTWAYYGGRIGGTSVANGTVVLTASTTNYVVVNRTTFAVSSSTNGNVWHDPLTYARLYKVVTDSTTVTSYEDHRFGRWGVFGAGVDPTFGVERVYLHIPIGSDLTTALTVASSVGYLRASSKLFITAVRASLLTASSSGAVSFDVKVDGASILGTALSIDANEKTSVTAATAYAFLLGGQHVNDDSEITVDVTGAGTNAAGGIITLICLRGFADPAYEFLVSRLHADGSNGDTTFTDVRGLTWTRSGGTQLSTTQAKFGATSISFNGSSDDLRSAAHARWSMRLAFCLDLWIYPTSFSGGNVIVPVGKDSSNRCILYQGATGTLRLNTTLSGSGADRITGSAPTLNAWNHVRLSFDLTTYRLWLNGVSQGTSTTSTVYSGTDQSICLGYDHLAGSASNRFAGFMDEFSWYSGTSLSTSTLANPTRANVDG